MIDPVVPRKCPECGSRTLLKISTGDGGSYYCYSCGRIIKFDKEVN